MHQSIWIAFFVSLQQTNAVSIHLRIAMRISLLFYLSLSQLTAGASSSILLLHSMPTSLLALLLATLAPPLVQRRHVARKQWFAQLFIDHIVLLAQPLAQGGSRRGLDRLGLQILLKVVRAPRAGIETGKGAKEAGHFSTILGGGMVGIPCGHGMQQIPTPRSNFATGGRALHRLEAISGTVLATAV